MTLAWIALLILAYFAVIAVIGKLRRSLPRRDRTGIAARRCKSCGRLATPSSPCECRKSG